MGRLLLKRRPSSAASIERHRDHGARLLGEFARDTSIDGTTRVQAAEALAGLDVHQTTGAELLLHFVREGFGGDMNDALNDTDDRARSASPNAPEANMQLMAVGVLAGIEEYRSKAVALLTEFARCATLTGMSAGVRIEAAETLLAVEGHRAVHVRSPPTGSPASWKARSINYPAEADDLSSPRCSHLLNGEGPASVAFGEVRVVGCPDRAVRGVPPHCAVQTGRPVPGAGPARKGGLNSGARVDVMVSAVLEGRLRLGGRRCGSRSRLPLYCCCRGRTGEEMRTIPSRGGEGTGDG
ncbi:hypothetical protein ACGF12_37035 [Kitasatospora sp. NPDC048296]|uniref:hypothetical protein n=1 Tax=Kitasatospora sp. NPDC048296 TaxID=3364048 RepID=UPI003723F623